MSDEKPKRRRREVSEEENDKYDLMQKRAMKNYTPVLEKRNLDSKKGTPEYIRDRLDKN
jgi:hypothetical protein